MGETSFMKLWLKSVGQAFLYTLWFAWMGFGVVAVVLWEWWGVPVLLVCVCHLDRHHDLVIGETVRVIGHMVVGPGEVDRYLFQVIDRAYLWADEIHVALDADAGDPEIDLVMTAVDAWQQMPLRWRDHEGKFRQAAWESMVEAVHPTDEDFILVFDADEVIQDYDMVQKAAKMYPGQRIGFTFHEMWSPTHYRVDRRWRPYPAWIMFPFRHGGRFVDKALACGREPSYVQGSSEGSSRGRGVALRLRPGRGPSPEGSKVRRPRWWDVSQPRAFEVDPVHAGSGRVAKGWFVECLRRS